MCMNHGIWSYRHQIIVMREFCFAYKSSPNIANRFSYGHCFHTKRNSCSILKYLNRQSSLWKFKWNNLPNCARVFKILIISFIKLCTGAHIFLNNWCRVTPKILTTFDCRKKNPSVLIYCLQHVSLHWIKW